LIASTTGSARPTHAQQSAAPATAQQSEQYTEAANFILNLVANQNQGTSFGNFLNTLGFGDTTGPALASIQSTLKEINAKLDQVQNGIKQLSGQIAQSECTLIQTTLGGARAKVESLFGSFQSTVAQAQSRDQSQRKSLAASFHADLRRDDPGSLARNIHNALSGPGVGANSMVTACGVAFEDRNYNGDWVTSQLHKDVTALVAFWQTLEAEATMLDVQKLQFEKQPQEAAAAVAQTRAWLESESKLIKPSVGDGLALDTRSSKMWRRVMSTGSYSSFKSVVQSAGGHTFRLATLAELQQMMQGCCNSSNSIDWVHQKTPLVVPQATNVNGQVVSSTFYFAYAPIPTLRLYGGPLWDSVGWDANCYAAFVATVDARPYVY
jgi:prefoldin subunit 5